MWFAVMTLAVLGLFIIIPMIMKVLITSWDAYRRALLGFVVVLVFGWFCLETSLSPTQALPMDVQIWIGLISGPLLVGVTVGFAYVAFRMVWRRRWAEVA
ncbi:hypothetical protein [Coralliovum pocilloporae]|uniref:hypothetical protein n=1 Tax=Coralliovum pocilloporae TaxID=3066369 RepID=UPI00330777D5